MNRVMYKNYTYTDGEIMSSNSTVKGRIITLLDNMDENRQKKILRVIEEEKLLEEFSEERKQRRTRETGMKEMIWKLVGLWVKKKIWKFAVLSVMLFCSFLFILYCVGSFANSVSSILFNQPKYRNISENQYRQIELGMTGRQVKNILGQATIAKELTGKEDKIFIAEWVSKGKKDEILLVFGGNEGKLIAKSSKWDKKDITYYDDFVDNY